MDEWLSRTGLLIGDEKLQRLSQSNILVVGTGGVGAYAAEMLCRAGVGRMTIIDGDVVSPSNINRQLIALHSTIGKPKTEILADRLKDINPSIVLKAEFRYLSCDDIKEILDSEKYDYVIDAIDTLAPKITLIEQCIKRKLKIISSMGAGGRTDPAKIIYGDISDTYHCSLAKAVRKRLQSIGIKKGLKVVFSTEQADKKAVIATSNERNKKSTVGTISYLPAMFGCYLAAFVIRKITEKK
ncbi:tRNA threonylcarbamoyladenosine dehydratase [Coprobacter tertius]|uniref:tRNA threonylcarbamoyladenosine dehydratase n=1 Tax=Coprobacter tertius TaxID=2944915 RepID=A0ABT1MGV7_9BACT|nr:tRNA threonylcarbamoyladenosine dehydratase [Coprobacter tertius]MCP9610476.1 tRNA threonylcarbamoyladenosine dehydratase [Coprobacter tertius]